MQRETNYPLPYLALSDSSKEGRLHKCTRFFEFNKMYGHAREDYEEYHAAAVGHCLHKAYQTYVATKDKQQSLAVLWQEYPIHLQRSENDPRSIYAAYAAFEQMLQHPIDARYSLAFVDVKGEKKPAIEVPCRMIFKDVSVLKDRHVPIYWDMFIDAILWDNLEQRFVVMDIKTTRKQRYDYSTMFKRDPQCLPYAYILEQVLGQPAKSFKVIYFVVFIDVMQPKAIKYEFEKTESDVEEWGFDTAMDIYNIKMMADMGFFPRRGKKCDDYKECIYNGVCDSSDPDYIIQYLEQKFGKMDFAARERDFNPWFELELTIQGLE